MFETLINGRTPTISTPSTPDLRPLWTVGFLDLAGFLLRLQFAALFVATINGAIGFLVFLAFAFLGAGLVGVSS